MDLSILQHEAQMEQVNRLYPAQGLHGHHLPGLGLPEQGEAQEKDVFGPAYLLSPRETNAEELPLYTANAVLQSGENGETAAYGQDAGRLSRAEEAQLDKLEQRDAQVKAHEQAHVMAAGGQAGMPSYTYQTGPDGRRYAIGGAVNISIISNGDDQASLSQARTAERAALVNGEASSADMNTAQTAREVEARVRAHAIEQYQRQQGQFGVPGLGLI